MRALLAACLAAAGFRVTEAVDGSAMHAILARTDIDLVLLDVGLPGLDGLSLLREIRCNRHVRVIIVSGRGELLDRVVGLVGADDYVTNLSIRRRWWPGAQRPARCHGMMRPPNGMPGACGHRRPGGVGAEPTRPAPRAAIAPARGHDRVCSTGARPTSRPRRSA